jgi:integrase
MTLLELKYLHRYKDKDGNWRNYLRRPGCKLIPLPGEPLSEEFMAAYHAAMASTKEPSRKALAKPGTLKALALAFYRTPEFSNLAASSQKTYRLVLDTVLRKNGHRLVKDMPREAAKKLIYGIGSKHRSMANLTASVMRRMMDLAVEDGWRDDNPFARLKPYKTGSHHTWTADELDAFEAKWEIGTRQRLAFAVLLYTGQRGGDAIRIKRSDMRRGAIYLTQQKTGKEMVITVHADLDRIIRATPANGVHLIGDEVGRQMSRNAFGKFMRKAIEEAGLPRRCVPHGLRKAVLTQLASEGASLKELKAVSGHNTTKEVERYTENADQERLNRSAIAKLNREKRGWT